MSYEITEEEITQIQKMTLFAVKALVMYKKDEIFKKLVDSCNLEFYKERDSLNLPELIKTISEIAIDQEVVLKTVIEEQLQKMKPFRAEIHEAIKILIDSYHSKRSDG